MRAKLALSTIVLIAILGVAIAGIDAQDAEPSEPKRLTGLAETDENQFAAECWGKWEMHKDITKFVTREKQKKDFGTVEFKKSKSDTSRMMEKLEVLGGKLKARGEPNDLEFLKAIKSIYAAGSYTYVQGKDSVKWPFAVINMFGEPLLVILEGKGDNINWQFIHFSFVRDAKGDHDMFFIGGQHKETPYIAMKRDGVK